ncbi:hypothetical protein WICMUC_005839 [Wickerhamomyces mucosus]|uniref:N-acetyltransferase domain-containing protein n=1 Tax=Wickerhamomyces mucosus TaxID=1378264 RepID=A0A9P8T3Z4_9ASCO|nr:hypothetical protein WICMUC_005839 [Wickerhamomyces mucosus]
MPSIDLDDITIHNKKLLQVINEKTLPIIYDKEFYNNPLNGFSKIAYYGEIPVGIIKAKLIVPSNHSIPTSIYIESLAILKPYRNLGIGKKFIEFIKDEAKRSYLHEIKLHVWNHKSNTKLIEWYQNLGFEIKEELIDYYKKFDLETPNAYLLSIKF